MKLGLSHTQDQLNRFKNLHFMVLRMRMSGERGYDSHDQEQYDKDCDDAAVYINSAIENLEMDIVPGDQDPSLMTNDTRRGSNTSGVHIGQAANVILGDANIISIVENVNIKNILETLQKEIESKVADPVERKSLLERLKAISENPVLNTILDQTLSALLKAYFGT